MRWQIPSASDGKLFVQLFEDHDTPTNRTAGAPLNLARYLTEQQSLIDRDWRASYEALLGVVRRDFSRTDLGLTVRHEQDEDRQSWGGIDSTYGAVLARFAEASGDLNLAVEAQQALDFTLYSIDEQGRPRDLFKNALPGGWQEDTHTDVLHNFMDILRAYPEWS